MKVQTYRKTVLQITIISNTDFSGTEINKRKFLYYKTKLKVIRSQLFIV